MQSRLGINGEAERGRPRRRPARPFGGVQGRATSRSDRRADKAPKRKSASVHDASATSVDDGRQLETILAAGTDTQHGAAPYGDR